MCACVELTKTAVPSEMGGGVAQPCIKKHIIFIILSPDPPLPSSPPLQQGVKIDPFFRLGLPIPGQHIADCFAIFLFHLGWQWVKQSTPPYEVATANLMIDTNTQ